MPELGGTPAGERCICSLREAPPRFQNVRAESPAPPGCAFLPLTPLVMTKLSFKHKTFSQRGGAIDLGVRNTLTRLRRSEGLSPWLAAASVCCTLGWQAAPNNVPGPFSSLPSTGFGQHFFSFQLGLPLLPPLGLGVRGGEHGLFYSLFCLFVIDDSETTNHNVLNRNSPWLALQKKPKRPPAFCTFCPCRWKRPKAIIFSEPVLFLQHANDFLLPHEKWP